MNYHLHSNDYINNKLIVKLNAKHTLVFKYIFKLIFTCKAIGMKLQQDWLLVIFTQPHSSLYLCLVFLHIVTINLINRFQKVYEMSYYMEIGFPKHIPICVTFFVYSSWDNLHRKYPLYSVLWIHLWSIKRQKIKTRHISLLFVSFRHIQERWLHVWKEGKTN
jgi:hypothetical protein